MEGRILSDATNQQTHNLRFSTETKDAACCSTPKVSSGTPRTPHVSSVMVCPTPTHSHSPYRYIQKLEAVNKLLTARVEKERSHRHVVKRHLEDNDAQKTKLLEELNKKQTEFLAATTEARQLHSTVLELRTKVVESNKERQETTTKLESEIQRLRKAITARDAERTDFRKTLDDLEAKYRRTKEELGQVQDTIQKFNTEDKARVEATQRQATVYKKLKLAEKRKAEAISTPGKDAATEKRAYMDLLQEYKDATANMQKSMAKSARLEQEAQDLLNEIKTKDRMLEEMSSLARRLENEVFEARTKEDEYRVQVQRLSEQQGSLTSLWGEACQEAQKLQEQEQQLSEQLGSVSKQLQHAEGEKAEVQEQYVRERERLAACKAEMEERVRQLEQQLNDNQVQLDEARANVAKGTPRGEGAKYVLRKSFEKIRALQHDLEEAHAKQHATELQLSRLAVEVGDVKQLEEERQRLAAERAAHDELIRQIEGHYSKELETMSAEREEAALQAQELTAIMSTYMQQAANYAAEIEALKAERDQAVEEYHKLGAENLDMLESLELCEEDLVDIKYSYDNAQEELEEVSKENQQLNADNTLLQTKVRQLEDYQAVLLEELSEKEEQLLHASSTAQAAQDLNSEVSCLRKDLASKQADTAMLIAQVARVQQQNETLRQELAESKSKGTPRGESAKQVLQRSFSKIKDLNSELKAAKSNEFEASEQIFQLETALNEAQENLSVAENRLTEQEHHMSTLQQQLQHFEQESLASMNLVALERDSLKATADDLRSQLTQAKQSVQRAEESCGQRDDRILQLENNCRELQSELEGLKSDLQTAVQQREADASQASGHTAALRLEVAEKDSQLKATEEELSVMKQQLMCEEAESARLQCELLHRTEVMEAVKQELRDEVALLRCSLHEAQGRNQHLELSLEATKKHADRLQAELFEARKTGTPRGEGAKIVMQKSIKKINNLQDDLMMAKHQLELLKHANTKIEEMETVIAGMEMELESKRIKVSMLQSQLEGQELLHSNDAADKVAEIERLKEQIVTLTQEKDQIVRQFSEKEAEMLDQIDSLHQQLQRVQQRSDQETDSSLEQLNELHEQLQSELGAVTEEKQKLLKEKTQLTKEVQNLMSVMGLLEGHSESASRQVAELQEALEQVEKEKNDALQAKEVAQVQFDELHSAYSHLDSRIDNFEEVRSSLADMQQQVVSSEQKIKQALHKVHELNEEVRALEGEKRDLQLKYARAQQHISKLQQQLRNQDNQPRPPPPSPLAVPSSPALNCYPGLVRHVRSLPPSPITASPLMDGECASSLPATTASGLLRASSPSLMVRTVSHSEIEPASPLHGIANTDMVDRLSAAWHFSMVGSKGSRGLAFYPPTCPTPAQTPTARPYGRRRK